MGAPPRPPDGPAMSAQALLQTRAARSDFTPAPRPLIQRKCACGAHTPGGGSCERCGGEQEGLQRKLAIGASNDPLEHEADRIADQVLGASPERNVSRAPPNIQRLARNRAASDAVPASVERALQGSGHPLDSATRGDMEQRFGHDFSGVRIHQGGLADESARDLGARAYTRGSDIVFGSGQFAPGTGAGRRLLAHELTHVVQQGGGRAGAAPAGLVQRAETLGTKVTHSKGAKSPFKKVTCAFDGANFTMTADGKTVLTAAGQSGRPNTVNAADAKACGGKTTDSYLNNPRYVGIKDNGPIPEGTYSFTRASMVQFTTVEQAKMALASPGTYKDPSGSDLHGDWGAGRAALNPGTIKPSAFCGDTSKRSGFYLHGGVMPGSSGCIDIGDSAISSVISLLDGYTASIPVTVKYTIKAPPTVGALDRAAGRFMYPKKKDASIWDRIGEAVGGD